MKFCFNINLVLFDNNSTKDFWNLSELFDDCSLSDFIDDNIYSQYIYFIKEYNDIIGFVYLMNFKNSEIYNIEYNIKSSRLNVDYLYTVLTLIRDKIKGINGSTEIKDLTIVSSVFKNDEYNEIVSIFGDLIHSNELYNYYEVNPNCEDLSKEKEKILKFLYNKK